MQIKRPSSSPIRDYYFLLLMKPIAGNSGAVASVDQQ